MAFADDKNNLIEVLQEYKCFNTTKIASDLSVYEDLKTLIYQYIPAFSCDTTFLSACAATIDDTELQNIDVFNGKNEPSTTKTDPHFVCASNYEQITLSKGVSETYRQQFAVIGGNIDKIVVDGAFVLGVLIIAGGADVKVVETINDARIDKVIIAGCHKYNSKLRMIVEGSNVLDVEKRDGGEFGGYESVDTSGECADEVTNLGIELLTHSSLKVAWTPPGGSIGVSVKYKESNTSNWKYAGEEKDISGMRVDEGDAFVFTGLKPNTYYDFKVYNYCANGIGSDGAVISVKTDKFSP